jgi:hypothetical protein
MSLTGHSRPAPTGIKFGHVRYWPILLKNALVETVKAY